ncbi:putative transposase-associated domain-containing protein [Tanacetum coccineum]
MGNIDPRGNKQHLLMLCLCTNCLNHIKHKVEEVQFYLFRNRIDLSYTKWNKHGEKDEPSISSPKPVNATTEFVDDTVFALDIPTDGPSIVEMVNATKNNFDEDDLVKFQELLLDAEKPLYKGCPDFTKLSAIVKLLNLKDSQAWRTIDEKFPKIAEDPRNLRLGISADGVDVNRGNRHHSVWPVLTIIYNLPPWLCMKRKFIMLSVLISGYPRNDIDVFLEPLVDDLHTLFETGVDTYDASTKDNFNLRAVVLWTINDYPALGTLCGCPYSGFKGCVVCRKDTNCVRLSALSKQSYVGHRQYLPYNHPFRKQKKAFNGQQEFLLAPNPMTGEQIYNKVQHIENKWGKGKRTNNKASENQEDTRGRCGKIQKQKRNTTKEEGSSSQVNRQNEKNVVESLVGTLLNVSRKTKDGVNARLDQAELGVKPELFTMQEEDKTILPLVGYTLTNAEKYIFCEMLYNIKVIKGHVQNKNRPEGCIAEETIAEETIEFFSEYHKSKKTIGIPPDKHETDENEEGKQLSAGKSSKVSAELFQKAHLRHKQVLKIENPGKRIEFLENKHSKSFAKWLREEVERELTINKESVSEIVRWISYGPRVTVVKVGQIPLFKCDWVNHKYGGVKCDKLGYTLVDLNNLGCKVDPFVLASQALQVFYVKGPVDKKLSIVFKIPPKNYKDTCDEVDEEFSTVIHHRNDNVLPFVDRRDLANESRDDY